MGRRILVEDVVAIAQLKADGLLSDEEAEQLVEELTFDDKGDQPQ